MDDLSKVVGYSKFCNVNSTENKSVIPEDVQFGYIVFALIVAILGILGNSSIAILFLKKKRLAHFYHLMVVLSAYDNLSIILNLLLFIIPNLIKSEENIHQMIEIENSLIPIGYPILETALTSSIYFTLAITIERYLIVCHPFYAFNRDWPFLTYMLPISLFSVLYNIPRYYEFQTLECHNGEIDTSNVCSNETNLWRRSFVNENHNCSLQKNMLTFSSLGCSKNYFVIYKIALDSILRWIVPFFLLIVLNGITLKKIHKSLPQLVIKRKPTLIKRLSMIETKEEIPVKRRMALTETQKEDIKLSVANMVMVCIFIVCFSMIWIPRLYEYVHKSETDLCKMRRSIIIGYFFTTLNSSLKCYVYFLLRCNAISYFKFSYFSKYASVKKFSTAITMHEIYDQ